jgi:hypothetical protein
MRKKIVVLLCALNVLMGAVLFGAPRANAQTELEAKGCCKKSVEGVWYCCADCCMFSTNCKMDQNCQT